jgi:hypothetical protein
MHQGARSRMVSTLLYRLYNSMVADGRWQWQDGIARSDDAAHGTSASRELPGRALAGGDQETPRCTSQFISQAFTGIT